MNNDPKLFAIATGIMILIIIFSVAFTLGARMESGANIERPAAASGTLSAVGNMTMESIVTIGTVVYQFTYEPEGPWEGPTVPVNITDNNASDAHVALAAAINNNTTSSAILTASASSSGPSSTIRVTYDTVGVVGNNVQTTTNDEMQIWGDTTLTGGVDDAGWASSDQTTGADVWADNATLLSLAVTVLAVSVILFYVMRMRDGPGGPGAI